MTDLEVSSTEAIADWIETSVLVSSSGHFGRDKLDDLAAAEIGATPMKVAMALDAMAKRATVLGSSYPFSVSDMAVLRRNARDAEQALREAGFEVEVRHPQGISPLNIVYAQDPPGGDGKTAPKGSTIVINVF